MASKSPAREGRETILRLFAEKVSIGKMRVTTGRVGVSVVTRKKQLPVNGLLSSETAEIECVPLGVPVERIPEVRSEGDTLIVPVVDEILRIERQLILKEEIRIRRVRSSRVHQELVTIREQKVSIRRQSRTQEAAEP